MKHILSYNLFELKSNETFEENGDYPGIFFVWRKMNKKPAGHYPLPIGADTAFEKLNIKNDSRNTIRKYFKF